MKAQKNRSWPNRGLVWAPRVAPSPFALDTRGGAPSPGRPSLGAAPPSPSIYREVSFQFRLEFCLHLALATQEHAQNSAVLVYSELHLREIIRLLASFSCSFFDCGQETIFVIRLILHQQGR